VRGNWPFAAGNHTLEAKDLRKSLVIQIVVQNHFGVVQCGSIRRQIVGIVVRDSSKWNAEAEVVLSSEMGEGTPTASKDTIFALVSVASVTAASIIYVKRKMSPCRRPERASG
jgi:hypothetical protein